MRPFYRLLLALGLLFQTPEIFAQVHAAFTSSTPSGCTPLVVTFTDQSTGSPTSYLWDFGNGNTSVQRSPAAAYLAPGQYTVKLTVRNASSTDSVVKTNYITVFFPPTAQFSAGDTVGCAPKNILFANQSVPGSAAITSWTYDFGDGTTSNQSSPSHNYTSPGTYGLVLLVKDANGCVDRITKPNYVVITPLPVPAFTASATSVCGINTPIDFTNTTAGTGNTYIWDFGDGTGSTQSSPQHAYGAGGTYTVKLTVNTTNGCTATTTKTNYITVTNFHAAFTVDHLTACVGSSFQLTDQSTPSASAWSWDLGGGRTSTVKNPSVSYSAPGTYTIKLVSRTAGGCTDSLIKTAYLTVTPTPVAAITSDVNTSCNLPFTVNFTGSPTGMNSYAWTYGDNTSGTGISPSHTYTAAGSYTVKLTVTDPSGCTSTSTNINYIIINPSRTAFKADLLKGCIPLDVTFTDQTPAADSITGWLWDFGDGSTSTDQNPAHTYTATGFYIVSLTTTNTHGCSKTITKTNYIKAGEKPVVNFDATPRATCAITTIHFSDLTTTGDEWNWAFGDGGTSIQQNPIYHYSDTGLFTVRLIVGNNGCYDTLRQVDFIHIYPPIAKFSSAFNCTDPYTVNFTNNSIGGNEYHWTFGDGDTSSLPSPTHLYPGSGSYSIKLLVRDTVSGCIDSTMGGVVLTRPVANFSANRLSGCKPLTTTFTSTSIDAASYSWNFGDGTALATTANATHTYANTGQYTVTLTIKDINNCTSQMVKTNYITVFGAKAGFSAAPLTGCAPLTVNYVDSSSAFMGTIVAWKWKLGNSDTSSLQNPGSIYTIAGSYTVTQIVTDNNGCIDSVKKVNYINPTFPKPAFSTTTPTVCLGSSIAFANQSTGSGLTYKWYFGDGDSSLTATPTHTYRDTGYYSVSLKLRDSNICDSILTKVNYIHIIKPHAAFTIDTNYAACPPLTVKFTDHSYDTITRWLYSFGDGQTSSLKNPAHIYTTPGVYHPKLIATNYLGCSDTIILADSIVVKGPSATFTFTQPYVCIPFDVTMVAHTSNNVASLIWDYGDGSVSSGSDTTTHQYTRTGVFNPVLIIQDSVGCTQSIPTPRPINAYTSHANFTTNTVTLCGSGNVSFTDQSTAVPALGSCTWYFGDGTSSTLRNPVHHYSVAGFYNIQLISFSTTGCSDTMTKPSFINVYAAPNPAFTVDDSTVCLHTPISFTDHTTSDSAVVSKVWYFGDGSSSSLQNPVHTYGAAGTYIVRLVAITVNGCIDTALKTITIYALSIANAGIDRTICVNDTVHMLATGGTSYAWSPATALSNASIANPISSTTATITYNLTVTDMHGCTATDAMIINVNTLPIVTISNDTSVCPGQPARISAGGGVSYQWSPATGLSNANIANPIANITATTTYQVTVINANGCKANKAVTVTLYPPGVANAFNDTSICVGFSAPIHAIGGVSYLWTPATYLDNAASANPISSPAISTTYSVLVTDAHGCKATDTVRVSLYAPAVAVASADTVICFGTSAPLRATGGVSYIWTPATTLSSGTIANPISTPTITNTYTVQVTDVHGCKAKDSVKVTVNALPVVTTSPDTSVCPGQAAHLSASGGTSYQWSPATGLSNANIANPIVNITATTTYTVLVTNANGCQSSGSVTVSLYAPAVANAFNDTSICVGFSAPIHATGGVSYLWTPAIYLDNATSANPISSPTANITYSVLVTDAHGCKATDTVRVSLYAPAVAVASPDTTICFGASASLHATGGVSYIWTPVTTLSNALIADPISTPTSTNTYTVQVTDVHGCKAKDSVTVTVNSLPVVITSHDTSVCPGQAAHLSASGGTSYQWSPATGLSNANIANPIANITATTTYTVLVTNANGCQSSGSVTVSLYAPAIANAFNDTSICVGFSAPIHANGGVSYQWTPTTYLDNATSANPMSSPTASTTYSVLVTDAHGCKATDTVRVSLYAPAVAVASPDTVICYGASVPLYATGGVNYSWTPAIYLDANNIANPISTPSVTTTYSVLVTDANGCQAKDSITIKVNALPIAIASNDTSVCPGQTASISATGGIAYQWSPMTGLSNSNSARTLVNIPATTTYFVMVTDTNGCKAFDSVTVSLYAPAVATAFNDTSICIGFSAPLRATGGVSYLWTPTSYLNNATSANPISSPAASTTYSVLVTDAHGCKATDTVRVSLYAPAVAVASPDTVICFGASVPLHATGGVIYSWTPSTALDASNIANPMSTPSVTTKYTVLVTDANGCQAKDSVTIKVNALPTAIASNDTSICPGQTANISATGGVAYQWSPTTGLSNSNSANSLVNTPTTRTYFVMVTDTNGCKAFDSVTVNLFAPAVAVASPDTSLCVGFSTPLHATGGVSYTWTPALYLDHSNIENPISSPAASTTYTVQVTDANGCKANDTVTVSLFSPAVAIASPDTIICIGNSVSLHATGGTVYAWTPTTALDSNNIATPISTPTVTTTYAVLVTDVNGCQAKDTVTIKVNTLPVVTTSNDTSVCPGQAAHIFATGGTSYQWSPATGLNDAFIANPIVNETASATYTILVTNANGCQARDSVSVNLYPAAITTISPDTSVCIGNRVQLTATGGSQYHWSPSTGLSSTSIANPVTNTTATTTYTVLVTTTNGCKATDSVAIKINALPIVNATKDTTICDGYTVQLYASGGTVYQWTPSIGLSDSTIANPVASMNATTSYTVNVTDDNGCQAKDTVKIIVNVLPIVDAFSDPAVCGGDTLRLHATGGGTYSWLPTAGLDNAQVANPLFTADADRTYTVTITDAKGCKASDSVSITVKALPHIALVGDTIMCLGDSLNLRGAGDGMLVWSPAVSLNCIFCPAPIATPSVNTTYVLAVTGANACVVTDTLAVYVKPLPTVHTVDSASICAGDHAELITTGSSDVVSYGWTPAFALDDITKQSPMAGPKETTSYTVTVLNQYGCKAQDSTVVKVNSHLGLTVSNDVTICAGNSYTLSAAAQTINNINPLFEWSPADAVGEIHSSTQTVTPLVNTVYTVMVSEGNCIPDTQHINVTVTPLPTVDLGGTQVVIAHQHVALHASTTGSIVQYLWTPSDGCDTCATVQLTPSESSEYFVTVMDVNGCSASDSVKIKVLTSCEEEVFIPNTFTPNNDGTNDKLFVRSSTDVSIKVFRIFDRWGNLVFETNNISDGWNGIYKGQPAILGVYVYYVEGSCQNGIGFIKKGNVTLLK